MKCIFAHLKMCLYFFFNEAEMSDMTFQQFPNYKYHFLIDYMSLKVD